MKGLTQTLITMGLLLILLSSGLIIAQEGEGYPSLESLGFEFNVTFGIGGESSRFLDIETNNGDIFLSGYVNYDIQTLVPGSRQIRTTCVKAEPDFMKGEFSDKVSNCGNDGFLAKILSNGTLDWATFFGGSNDESIKDIVTDSQGNLIATGVTTSGNLSTSGAFDTTVDELGDVFVVKFNQSGGIDWMTYLGGSYVESLYNVLVDSQDNIIIVGMTKSNDFPLLHPFDNTIEDGPRLTVMDSFVTKISPDGQLIYSSYYGGSDIDVAHGISIDLFDNVLISGITRSIDFPVGNAPDEIHNGLIDVFLGVINPDGNLTSSGYIGGQFLDIIEEMKAISGTEIMIVGTSNSENFPIVNGADYQINSDPRNTVDTDAVVVKMNRLGQIQFSTYLGGDSTDKGKSIEYTENNTIVVVGTTSSLDFPKYAIEEPIALNRNTPYPSGDQPSDIFVSIYNNNGQYGYGMYYGGSGVERLIGSSLENNRLLILGETTSSSDTFTEIDFENPFEEGNFFLSSIKLPNIDNFMDIPEVENTEIEEDVLFYQTFDPVSYVIISVLLLMPVTRLIVKRLRNRKQNQRIEDREQTRQYLERTSKKE